MALAPRSILPKQVEAIFEIFKIANPEPNTELEYVNDYTLLVAVVLSAQSTDVGVNKATKALFKIADTPEKMLKLGEDGLKRYIKTIGLFNSKAKNIIALSKMLIEDFGGKIPRTREKLTTLPGVGRKTANVLLNAAYGEPTMAVDTHVFRVSQRIGLAKGKTPEEIEEQLVKIIPKKYMNHAHHWLILHGRYTCKARNPECDKCQINTFCNFYCKSINSTDN